MVVGDFPNICLVKKGRDTIIKPESRRVRCAAPSTFARHFATAETRAAAGHRVPSVGDPRPSDSLRMESSKPLDSLGMDASLLVRLVGVISLLGMVMDGSGSV